MFVRLVLNVLLSTPFYNHYLFRFFYAHLTPQIIDRTLSGATSVGQIGTGSDGNEGVLRILQSSCITETSPSACLVSFPGHSLGRVLPLCRDAVSVFCSHLPADGASLIFGLNRHGKIMSKSLNVLFFIHNSYFWLLLIHHHSSSCHATSTDISDPLSPLLPIVHRFWQVFRATSRILTELLCVCSSWPSCFCSVIWGGP